MFRGFAYVDFALLYSSYVAWTTSASYEVIISGGFSDTTLHQLDTLSARLSSWHLTSQRVLAQRQASTRIRRILGKRKRVEEEERRQPLKSCSRRASLAMVSYYWLIDVYYTEPEATGTRTSNPESVRGARVVFRIATFAPSYAAARLLSTKPLKGTDRVRSRVP